MKSNVLGIIIKIYTIGSEPIAFGLAGQLSHIEK